MMDQTDRRNRWIVGAIAVALAVNAHLHDKYNVFVGDDGILASHVFGYVFRGRTDIMLCADWNAHRVLMAVLGPLHRWSYGATTWLLDRAGQPLHLLPVMSLLYFLGAVAAMAATLRRSRDWTFGLLALLVFVTLEPVLVSSHSIRQEAMVFFGIALLLWSLVRLGPGLPGFLVTAFGIFALQTHPSGYPPIAAIGVASVILGGWRAAAWFVGAGLLASLVWLAANGFASPEHLADVRATFAQSGGTLALPRWGIIDNLRIYFLEAKYKRHLIELLIVAVWAAPATRWRELTATSRVLLWLPALTFALYVAMGYLNHYYVSYFLQMMLVSAAFSWGDLRPGAGARRFALVLPMPFIALYALIAITFLPSPGWGLLEAQREAIEAQLPADGHFAAPFYFAYLDPRRTTTYLPLTQVNEAGACEARFGPGTPPRVLMVDAQNAAVVAPVLAAYREVARFHIGRLSTQSLDDSGELVAYALR
jgi:hypothetical protein